MFYQGLSIYDSPFIGIDSPWLYTGLYIVDWDVKNQIKQSK